MFELIKVLTVDKPNQSGRNKRFNIKTLLSCEGFNTKKAMRTRSEIQENGDKRGKTCMTRLSLTQWFCILLDWLVGNVFQID